MEQFKVDVSRYWTAQQILEEGTTNLDWNPITNEARRQALIEQYEGTEQEIFDLREKLTKQAQRAKRIARKNGAPVDYTSYPAPAVGGPILNINLIDALFIDYSYRRIGNEHIWDGINQALGACEERVETELRHLKNPLYWIKAALIFVLRIPFMIIEATGFDVSKVEDHFLAKLFKLVEVVVIFYILLRVGAGRKHLLRFSKA